MSTKSQAQRPYLDWIPKERVKGNTGVGEEVVEKQRETVSTLRADRVKQYTTLVPLLFCANRLAVVSHDPGHRTTVFG